MSRSLALNEIRSDWIGSCSRLFEFGAFFTPNRHPIRRKMLWAAALSLTAGLSMAGAASAAPCRDASGHFAKCPAAAAAKPAKCRDAKGHFTKCEAAARPAAIKK